MMKTISVTDLVATGSGSHLRQFNPVPVFVFSPVSGAAVHAFWLGSVDIWVLPELSSGSAGSAAAMRFHSISPIIAIIMPLMYYFF